VTVAARDDRPLDVLTSPGYLLMKAGHYIGLEFEAVLAGLELNAREFLVLSFARTSDDLSQQDLSTRLAVDPTIVVGLIDALEDRGLITRTKDPADRRRNVLSLTPAGAELHNAAVAEATTAQDAFFAQLPAGEREQFRTTLRTILTPRLPWLNDR